VFKYKKILFFIRRRLSFLKDISSSFCDRYSVADPGFDHGGVDFVNGGVETIKSVDGLSLSRF